MKANAQTPLSDFVAREMTGKGKAKGKGAVRSGWKSQKEDAAYFFVR